MEVVAARPPVAAASQQAGTRWFCLFVCWLTSCSVLITHPGIHSPPIRRLSPSSGVFSQHSAQSQKCPCPEEVSGLVAEQDGEATGDSRRSSLILLSHTSHLSPPIQSLSLGTDGMTGWQIDGWMSRCQDPGLSPVSSLQTQAPALFLTPIPRKGWEGQARDSCRVCVSACRSAWAPALSPTIPDSLEQGPQP